tara:strand:+ start:13636 stop:14325 length:690 start_codon:yes stop_codon:yes gene_type:complete
MATSGTSTFNLDIDEIIDEAFERAGLGRAYSGSDFRTARRSLNLLSQEFANRGVNLWTVEDTTQALTSGTATYTLPADTVSILDYAIRTGTGTSQVDTAISRMHVGDFASLSSKNTTGRPVQIYIERLRDAPQITVWPVPNNNTYTLVYYRVRRIQDTINGGEYQYDAPTRFLPAVVAGLAYHVALKNPNAFQRVPLLKQMYEEEWQLAATEDRDRSNFKITPLTSYAS